MSHVKKTTSVSLLSLSTDPRFNHLKCGITGQGVMSLSLSCDDVKQTIMQTADLDKINNLDTALVT